MTCLTNTRHSHRGSGFPFASSSLNCPGIVIFSIGEMTAHPKFISYVGLTAPSEKKAMYMGYIFLYGVFGSSVGGIVGAKLYVYFVDTLNQPRTLWIVFSMIGVVTIISLLLYNKFLAPKKVEK